MNVLWVCNIQRMFGEYFILENVLVIFEEHYTFMCLYRSLYVYCMFDMFVQVKVPMLIKQAPKPLPVLGPQIAQIELKINSNYTNINKQSVTETCATKICIDLCDL